MENMCWLHGSQQNVSKGSVSFAAHRPSSRLNLRVRNPLLPWCVLRVPSNREERVWLARDVFRHPVRIVLLCHNVVRSKKHGGYVSMLYAQVFWRPQWENHWGLRGWHCGHVQMGWLDHSRPRTDPHETLSKWHQTQLREMYFQGPKGYASAWAFGFYRRFGSVCSVFQKFGFQKMTPDRFAKISKTDQFRFGFLVRFFG